MRAPEALSSEQGQQVVLDLLDPGGEVAVVADLIEAVLGLLGQAAADGVVGRAARPHVQPSDPPCSGVV